MQHQQRRAAISAASLLGIVVAVCCFLQKTSSGESASSLLQMFTMGLANEGRKYADRLYGDKLAVEEDLARIDALRGSLPGSSYDGRPKANMGIGERGLPDAFLLNGQQLAGWRAEQAELRSLEKKAEERLQKDLTAADNRTKAGDDFVQGYNATGGSIKLVKDDDGEELPDETLKAEAAALGFATVQEWQRAVAGHSLEALPSRKTTTPLQAKTEQKHEHETTRHVVPHIVDNGLTGIAKWISSIFAAKNSQQLYSVGSRIPEMPLRDAESTPLHAWRALSNSVTKPEMLDEAAHSKDALKRPPIFRSGVLALGRRADGVATFALVPM